MDAILCFENPAPRFPAAVSHAGSGTIYPDHSKAMAPAKQASRAADPKTTPLRLVGYLGEGMNFVRRKENRPGAAHRVPGPVPEPVEFSGR
jgi:hypothetical protein